MGKEQIGDEERLEGEVRTREATNGGVRKKERLLEEVMEKRNGK